MPVDSLKNSVIINLMNKNRMRFLTEEVPVLNPYLETEKGCLSIPFLFPNP